jgi:septum formation protein
VNLILASASSIRRAMLDAAGVEYQVQPSNLDEAKLKGEGDTRTVARRLAEAKALQVSEAARDDWVIGGDSVVGVGDRLFDKPVSRDNAVEHLRYFSGKTMELSSAVVLARGRQVDWSHVETARLQVRDLSQDFIESYLEQEWPEVGYCVGVFRMEGRGVQLFDAVQGDHFTILGMPLIPLLGALRGRGLIAK